MLQMSFDTFDKLYMLSPGKDKRLRSRLKESRMLHKQHKT